MLGYYGIYSREDGQNLTFITEYQAIDERRALMAFKNAFGENYGRVVVLPVMSKALDHAFGYSA